MIFKMAGLHVKLAGSDCAGLGGIRTFIFERQDDFTEILEFVRSANKAYKLQVEELLGDFKSGLSDLLSRRPVKAVVIGTRRQSSSVSFSFL